MVYDIKDKSIHPRYDDQRPVREKCLMALHDPCEIVRTFAQHLLHKLDREEKIEKKRPIVK